MKLKVLALSLVGLFTLAACGGNANNKGGSGDLPSGGEDVDVTNPEKSALLLEEIQGGLNKSLVAATGSGISVRLDVASNVAVNFDNSQVSLKNGKLNVSLDGKVDPAVMQQELESPLDLLGYLEAVAELRVGGDFKLDAEIPQYSEDGEQTGTKPVSLSLSSRNLGFKAEITDSTLYVDLSDRSILNFAVGNYRSVFSFLLDAGAEVPTVEQLEEMLGTEDLGQYATNLWNELGLDKVKVSAEDVAALMGGGSSEQQIAIEDRLAPQMLVKMEDYSETEVILATLAHTGILTVKEYTDQLGVQLSLNKDKMLEALKVSTYLVEHNLSLEGYDSSAVEISQEDAAMFEHYRKLNVNATALFDSEYRPISLVASADVDFDVLGKDWDSENEEYVQVVEATVKGDTSVNFTCDFAGPKVSPAKTHEGYTPITSIMAAIEAMMNPEREGLK